jgi:hypothetical protein
LSLKQIPVLSTTLNQLIMRSLSSDLTILYKEDHISAPDSSKVVRREDHGTIGRL